MASKGLEGFIPFKGPPTPGRLKQVAREELGETEELKAECLEKLKILIKNNDVTCIMRDDFLLRFLRYKKFDLEKSFQMLRNYARMRASIHEGLMTFSPEVLKRCLDLNILGFLPFRDRMERIIFFGIPQNWNRGIFSIGEFLMAYVSMLNYITEKEETQVMGFVTLYYDTCAPMSHLISLMTQVKFLSSFLFECLPARYPKIHIMSESFVCKATLRLVSPFLPKKLKNRILLQGTDGKELHEHLSPSILPYEFGGILGPLNNDHITEEIINYLQKMKDEQKYFIPDT